MKISELMSQPVVFCRPEDSLARAAELMWNHDLGWLPVANAGGSLVGVVTDRDVCMAAWLRDRRLHELQVGGVMSQAVTTCNTEDTVEAAHEMLRRERLHRLPVIDGEGNLTGVVTINDLAHHGAAGPVHDTLCSVSQPRNAPERTVPLPSPASKPAVKRAKSTTSASSTKQTKAKTAKPTRSTAKTTSRRAAKKK